MSRHVVAKEQARLASIHNSKVRAAKSTVDTGRQTPNSGRFGSRPSTAASQARSDPGSVFVGSLSDTVPWGFNLASPGTSLDHVSHHRTCLCIRALVLHACGQLLDRHRTAAKRLCDFEPMSCSRPKSLGLAPRLYLSLLLCRSYCHLAFNRSWIPAATSTS